MSRLEFRRCLHYVTEQSHFTIAAVVCYNLDLNGAALSMNCNLIFEKMGVLPLPI